VGYSAPIVDVRSGPGVLAFGGGRAGGRAGENIYPREIEMVLLDHPAVADAAVVGIPDQRWGEQVAAFIRPAPGSTPDEADLTAFCRERLASFKVPRFWQMLDTFPMTPSGKVQKFALRERLQVPAGAGHGQGEQGPSPGPSR
jgi:acyl-CoA synthetase (AMP-forming)/AMP-acid ligase II